MSNQVDRFVKQHKEYFLRNKKVIENNKWNSSESYDRKMRELSNEIALLMNSSEDGAEKKLEALEKQLLKLSESSRTTRAALFKQENELTNSILGRLSAFIKKSEGDRHEEKVQKFIDYTVSIINIHLQKCEDYLDYSLDVTAEDIEETEITIDYKNQEISFQDTIFNKKIEIEDKLDSLNISNSADNLVIEFYKKQKASLPLAAVLPAFNIDIALATDKMNLATEVYDTAFYINILRDNPDSIPQWNPKKHYWEQDAETVRFWQNEWLKITQGFWIDNYFVHPWLYFHLNFFKTPIPQPDNSEPILNPSFRDNEWYFAELLKKAEDVGNRGIMLYGSRRLGKSTLMGSYCYWKALTKPNATAAITSGADGDLAELTHKIRTGMKYIPYAFKLHVQKQEWDGGIVEVGLKSDPSNLIEYSRFSVRNLDGGAKGATQKTAGGAPSVFLIEEIGKFAFEKAYLAAMPSFETPYKWKCVPIAVGTGGEASLSGDAVKALANPKTLKFLEMDWDLLESKMPKSAITWKRRTFANFVPAQMSYKTGLRSIPRKFGDFLGIESTDLDKITIFQADWEHNTKVLREDRELVQGDSIKYQQEVVQYPVDPEECFLSAEKNPFPVMEAKRHKEYLIESGKIGKKVVLYRDPENGKIKGDNFTDSALAEYPFEGGFIDSPVVLYMDIPDNLPPNYMFVAGLDDYKQEESGTDSIGSFHIKMVDIGMHPMSGRIVASYSARPDPHGKFHRQGLMLLEAFNARCFMENEDMSFKEYLDRQRVTDKYLVESMDFNSDMQITYGGRRKYGWTPTPKNKRFLFELAVKYCKEEIEIEIEEDKFITLLGVETIPDIGLLDEIIMYKEGNNVDRITSFMSALGYEFFLFMNYMLPSIEKDRDPQQNKQKKQIIPKNLAQRMFGSGLGNRMF